MRPSIAGIQYPLHDGNYYRMMPSPSMMSLGPGAAMAMMIGKSAFLDLLNQEGVDTIFGNPGTTELPLMDQLAADNRFRYVLGLHEGAVVGMADGYAQASRKLTVVNLHAMPGLGNALGMLYDAQKGGAPLLVTAGQQDQSFLLSEPILHGDLATLARPLVKWSYDVHALRDLPMAVHRAAKIALSPPTGPVFLSLPGDVLMETADIDLGGPSRIAQRMRGDAAAIEAAAVLIAQSERPVIMAGDAVAQSDALEELVAFAEALGAPVYAESVSNTASFPNSHPLFAGTVARIAPAFRKLLDQHDLLISMGADLFTLSLPSNVVPMPPQMKVVHVDLDAWEVGKNYKTDVGLIGDPKAILPDLVAATDRKLTDGARTAIQLRKSRTEAATRREHEALRDRAKALATRSPIAPLALLRAIGDVLPADAIVVEELLSSAEGVRRLIRSDDANSFFGMRGGGIGWGIPAAIGIKMAHPHRPVVALVGDGSAMYTIQALWSAAHYRIPVTFVIFNNSSYRILKQRIEAVRSSKANTYVGMDLVDPAINYVGLATSLGVAAHAASSLSDAIDLIKQGLSNERAVLIDVTIERDVR
jgi:benzoylformate decarboxylase